jgi:predicted amidohydrolase
MFNTGFIMDPETLSEDMSGITANFLKRMAKELNTDITGSLAVKENGLYFNRLLWAKPDGTIFTYDKRHLFRMTGEDKTYTAGNTILTVNIKGWKIRPFICYDLRFPVWTRNTGLQYDLAVFTANWPSSREFVWETLLRARAIENLCYTAGVNRAGTDGNGLEYGGGSCIMDFLGNAVCSAGRKECIRTTELSLSKLISFRESFPAWKDSDEFEFKQPAMKITRP